MNDLPTLTTDGLTLNRFTLDDVPRLADSARLGLGEGHVDQGADHVDFDQHLHHAVGRDECAGDHRCSIVIVAVGLGRLKHLERFKA